VFGGAEDLNAAFVALIEAAYIRQHQLQLHCWLLLI
jgi:hypothetical protein